MQTLFGRIAAARTQTLLAVVAAAIVGACSSAAPGTASSTPLGTTGFSADAYLTAMADSGALSVQVRTSPQPPQRGTIGVELTVTSVADGTPLDGLTLGVVPWMPADNHGTPVAPTVTAEGDGKYLVTNVDLFMPGHWELRTTLSGPVVDHVTPAFDVP